MNQEEIVPTEVTDNEPKFSEIEITLRKTMEALKNLVDTSPGIVRLQSLIGSESSIQSESHNYSNVFILPSLDGKSL